MKKIINRCVLGLTLLMASCGNAFADVYLDVYNNSNAIIDIQEGYGTVLSPLQSATLRPGDHVHDVMWFSIDNLSIAYLAIDNRFYKIPGCAAGTFSSNLTVDVRTSIFYPYVTCIW